MTEPFYFSTTYVLDKHHFSETYDETSTVNANYIKAIVLALTGFAVLMFTEFSAYIAWFVVALAILEALSVRFHKPWWLTRQMISRAANDKIALTIDEESIRSQSASGETKILWSDISNIEKTPQGWLLYHSQGRSYLSDQCLSEEAKQFIRNKANNHIE